MKMTRPPKPLDFGASNDDAAARESAAGAPSLDLAQPPAPLAAAAVPEPAARGRGGRLLGSAWPLYLTAFAIAALWALGPIAFAVGYRNAVAPLQNDRFALLVFGLLAVGPAALMFGAAFFIRQGQQLAAEARRAREVEQSLLSPALRAAVQAGAVTREVREEIARAAAAAEAANAGLAALRAALAADSEALTRAAEGSLGAARNITVELGRERNEIQALTESLGAQAQRAAETVGQQARNVAEVSQAAETQLREAENTLATRAASLAAAADEVGAAVRIAGEDLVRHVARLEHAGGTVAEHMHTAEEGLSGQRAALVALSDALRADHQGFAVEADAYAAKLDGFISEARRAGAEMGERSRRASESLRDLIADAAVRFDEFAQLAAGERAALGEAAAESLGGVGRAAAEERARLEAESRAAIEAMDRSAQETRAAAARQATAAREQLDQLSEAAFAAGQKANQVFEARLEEARALVERSSALVGEAGEAAARRLDDGARAAREAVAELDHLLEGLEGRARKLPAEAEAQAEAVRTAVVRGMEALTAHARRTAEEAQAIDAAFQDRVRRNFEMLSEAVRLIGSVAAAPSPAPSANLGTTPRVAPPAEQPVVEAPASESPAPEAPEPPAAAARQTAPPGSRSSFAPYASPSVLPAPPEPVTAEIPPPPLPAPEITPGAALAERLGLRPRLKLTPTATDEEFTAVFDAAGGVRASASAAPVEAAQAPPEDIEPALDEDEERPAELWTWKDLLASLKSGAEEGADREGEAYLEAELGKLGLEPEKLLPRARIDQIAAAVQAGDADGARQVVKRLAGAGARRLVRRLFTDPGFRGRAQAFVDRYQRVVDDAGARDPEGLLTANVLAAQGGRVYLLLDQALGDAG